MSDENITFSWRPQDLLLLLDVLETGSFQAAADRHHLDRSVVSRRINQLERNLGVRLLQRSTRSQSLTAAGQELIKSACQLRRLLNETDALAQSFQTSLQGLLRITSASHYGQFVVMPLVKRFMLHHPEVQVEVRLEDREVDLIAEGFDLAIRIGRLDDSQLFAQQLAPHPLRLVASPAFLARYGPPSHPEALSVLPAISYRSNRLSADRLSWINSAGHLESVPMNVVLWLDRIDLIRECVLEGMGYALMSAFMVDDLLDSRRLVRLLPETPLPDYAPIYVVYPHRELPLRTRLFIDALSQANKG